MSGPVDVLAVMDDARGELHWTYSETIGQNLVAARAAVAELIRCDAVMREALADLKAQCANNLEVGATGPGYWADARETIDAALANAGAAK